MSNLFTTLFGISIIIGWVTHIVVCLSTGAWGFLIAGALLFPIAWVHGWMVLLGFA